MQDSIQLFTAQNGKMSAKVVLPNNTTRHIHSVINPSIESKFFEKLELWGDVIVFAGIGLGYHLTKKIKFVPSTTILVIIDYYDELTLLAKNGLFSGLSNTMIFVSETSGTVSIAASIIKENALKRLQIVKHPASFDIHKKYYEQTLALLFSDTHKLSSVVNPNPPCAVLLYGNFFLEKEIQGALQSKGIEPVLFHYNNLSFRTDFEDRLTRLIQEKRPLFIFSINMKGFDGNGSFAEITHRFGIPVFVWFVDDPRPIVLHKRQSINSTMIALSWEKAFIPFLNTLGFNKVSYVPLASDLSLFHGIPSAQPSVPLGFVGSAMVDEFSGNIRGKFLWKNSLWQLVETAADALLSNPLFSVMDNIHNLANSLSLRLPFDDEKNITWLCVYCIEVASMKKRKRIIDGLMDFGIETFGDPEGWKRLLGEKIKTNPNIDYRNSLCDTYRKICVNINITSCQMQSSVNQRVFDIPLSGSFVISDNQNDLQEMFDINKEMVTYTALPDLRDKVRYYLAHETERSKIISAAQIRIKNKHLYVHRINTVLGLL